MVREKSTPLVPYVLPPLPPPVWGGDTVAASPHSPVPSPLEVWYNLLGCLLMPFGHPPTHIDRLAEDEGIVPHPESRGPPGRAVRFALPKAARQEGRRELAPPLLLGGLDAEGGPAAHVAPRRVRNS